MAKRTSPADFTVTELKAMLAAKTKIDELTAQRDELQAAVAKIDKELASLLGGKVPAAATRKKTAKTSPKRPARSTAAKAATTAPKRGRPKKAAGVKAAAKKPTRAKPAPRGGKGPTIEAVVIDVIKANGGKMAFQEVLATIQKKKLIKTTAKDFANVLRRTISTSGKIKRAGRGVYRA